MSGCPTHELEVHTLDTWGIAISTIRYDFLTAPPGMLLFPFGDDLLVGNSGGGLGQCSILVFEGSG